MTNSAIDGPNIVKLRCLNGKPPPKAPSPGCAGALSPLNADDPFVVDGLQLVRSFMLIEDSDMRASIIRLVEKIAEQNRIFKK
jgi:hypothetical protein